MDAKRLAILAVVLIAVFGGIYYLESQKAGPSNIPDNTDGMPSGTSGQPSAEGNDAPAPQVLSEEDLARINQKAKQYRKAPELQGITGYLNTNGSQVRISDFQGKVVLIDFWTYTCINCIRTFPHLNEWHDKYADDGLVIIGVHTPEFEFEKKRENVENALEKYGIEYRVVQDNDYVTWRAYENRFWPRKYLIDADGFIRYDHIGEGKYEETEQFIRGLLAEAGNEPDADPASEARDMTPNQPQTPELYAGYRFALPRDQDLGNPGGFRQDQAYDYQLPTRVSQDRIYLDGQWVSGEDNLMTTEKNAAIFLGFTSTAANIVASPPPGKESVEVNVQIDTDYVSEGLAGDDVLFDGNRSYILVEEPRLYNVYRGGYGQHLLTLTAKEAGFSFNAFTFG